MGLTHFGSPGVVETGGPSAKTHFGNGTGGTLALPTGVDVGAGQAGFYTQGGRVYMFGRVYIRAAGANYADIIAESSIFLPELPAGHEVDPDLIQDGGGPYFMLRAIESAVGAGLPSAYHWTDAPGAGWYIVWSDGPLDPAPTHDIEVYLDAINYPIAA